MKGPNTASFNGITFNNSKIWQFKTLPEQAENNGVCALDHVVIDPSSYLFQTTEAGVKENDSPDTNGNFDSTFDTVKDNDKVFTATARTADGQTIISVAGYKWEWEWGIENYAVVDFALEPNFDAGSTKQLIRAISTVVDDKTFVNVKATITEDEVFFSIPPGVEKTDRAEITVFLCKNPWPPVIGGIWSPWKDMANNCTVPDSIECFDTTYSLYYCRDAGGVGTADDLPAISSGDTTSNPIVIRGKYPNLNLLKETYFFREAMPDVSEINLTLGPVPTEGKKVSLSWSPIAPVETLRGYKIYYGVNSRNYDNDFEVGDVTSHTVNNLINNQTYYFAITAIYESTAESKEYSNEVFAMPEDTEGPIAPAINSITGFNERVEIDWSDDSNGDAVSFDIFYKAYEAPLICNLSLDFGGHVTPVTNNPAVITELSNNITYCFGMVGYDEYGNPSAITTMSAIPSTLVIQGIPTQNVMVNDTFDYQVEAHDSDGYGIASYAISGQPSGIIIDSLGKFHGSSALGTIQGYTVTVTVTNDNVPANTAETKFILNITSDAPVITIGINPVSGMQGSTNLPVIITGSNFQTGAIVSFSEGGITVVGTPTVNAAGTEITANININSGTAATTRNVTVTNPDGKTSNSKTFTVTALPLPQITTASLPNGRVGVAYSQTVSATGGIIPYSWSVISGSLPAGLSLSLAGVISGTPATAGTSNFTVQVRDSNSPASTV
ncbi:putative Ig domain-containing protein, partial [bacterium]|nr:putative Ig domain-containing protein [bacterium]